MVRKLDLRTGRPVWLAYRLPHLPAGNLVRDIETEVLVIGAGISGAMAAEALSAEGHKVTIIDRRGPIEGSTPASTALVQFEIDQPIAKLRHQIGLDAAMRAWRRARLAVLNLKARITDLGIACHATPRPTLYLAGNVLTGSALREEAELRRSAGLYSEYLTRSVLRERFGIDRDGAILSYDNLALDPRKLTAGLLLKTLARGGRLYEGVEATGFAHSGGGVEVATSGGPVISAQHVVLATGYELTDAVSTRGHSIISTWAIATRPQRGNLWPGEAFIWEAADPYLYLRTTHDGRVICGGEDAEFSNEEERDSLIAAKTQRIARKLKALLPALDTTPQYAWAGSFGTTPTGLPLIGPVPGKPRLFALMGYGGNGITFSRVAAEMVVAAFGGRQDADADLFALPRD